MSTTPAPNTNSSTTSAPPPGAPPGGTWGRNNYIGEKTGGAACLGFLCFCLPGLFILLCPFDERDAYMGPDGKVYDASGKVIGKTCGTKFVPKR